MDRYVPPMLQAMEAALQRRRILDSTSMGKTAIDPIQIHNMELFKTQNNVHSMTDGNVLIVVNYPEYSSVRSCLDTHFNNAELRLTYDQIIKTGSPILKQNLESPTYQARMRRRFGDPPPGVTHVLDLSPCVDEEEHALALQQLTITNGIKLWFRTTEIAAIPATCVGGHDDVCMCYGHPQSKDESSPDTSLTMEDCLYQDTPLAKHRDIQDYCPIRQAANTIRLFRAISGDQILIDSAPRLWTLVGLFSMFGMTDYDILRDNVASWMVAYPNSLFVEILPEESIHLASILKASGVAEPAFRILVNERAIVVAGEQPLRETSRHTVFGRKTSSCLSGTEHGESLLRRIEHAGVAMAERYKVALDTLWCDDIFAMLDISEWQRLDVLGQCIENVGPSSETGLRVQSTLKKLKEALLYVFRQSMEEIIKDEVPATICHDIARVFKSLIPKKELEVGSFQFKDAYACLNKYQRALCPFLWGRLRDFWGDRLHSSYMYANAMGPDSTSLLDTVKYFNASIFVARKQGAIESDDIFSQRSFFEQLDRALLQYTVPLLVQDCQDFVYDATPHLLLTLNTEEMNFLRMEDSSDSEAMYEAEIPETNSGPSGPGPAYHTGQTIGSASGSSVSDLGMDNLDLASDAGTVTAVGSVVVQDGISTVYDRRAVLTPSASIVSEDFTDDSNDFAEAQHAVPAEHQAAGQVLAGIVEEDESEADGSVGSPDSDVLVNSTGDEVVADWDGDSEDPLADDLSAYSHNDELLESRRGRQEVPGI